MKKKILYAALSLAIVSYACNPSDFKDINVSPNASETPLTSALLTNALTALGGSTTATLPGLYCQYFAETQYTDASRYSIQDINWAGEMAGSMYDLQNIININTDPATASAALINGSNNNQIAVARILKAYRFSILTDRYGDMPYTDALKQNTQPVYDKQQAIYDSLFKEFSEAVAQFDNGAPAKGDILFDGDITKWKKFANSFRLILALRVSKVNPDLGKAQFTSALNADGGVIDDNSLNVSITYPGGAFQNPWYGIGGDFSVCKTIADTLNDLGDERRFSFGHTNSSNRLIGVPTGLQRQDAINYTAANPDWSLVLYDDYRLQTSTLNILTYADVLLARAEAAERGWTTEDAEALYYEGIKASWEQWEVFDQEAYDGYIGQARVSYASGDGLRKICTQRWITFYPNGVQGYSEWRRTGYPALKPSPAPVNNSKQIPRRYIYPTIEYSLNKDNVNSAVTGLASGDTQESRIWWDK